MNLSRPTPPTLLLSGCIAFLAAALGYEHHQLTQLSGALLGTAEKASLDALAQRFGGIEERLDTFDGKKFLAVDDFRTAQLSLANRIDAAQAFAKEAHNVAGGVSRSAANNGELLVLKAEVEALGIAIQTLQRTSPKPVSQKLANKSSAKVAVTKKTSPKPPVPEPPPFHVMGVEYRGGERFLSVAPPGSTQLSQINLLRPGDAIAGTAWRLSALDDQSARFDVSGNSRTLTIQP